MAENTFIGLDSFELVDEEQISGELPATDLKCPDEPQTTITCDFETDDLCGWTNMDAITKWDKSSGNVGDEPQNIPGPEHGTFYLTASANNRPLGDSVATIVSRPMSPSMPKRTKLSFSYHMKGHGIRYLRLVLRDAQNNHVTLWERKGYQGRF